MATQAETPAGTARVPGKRKPVTPFGGALPIAIIGIVATVVGFLPTFFLRLTEVDAIHHAHGWTMIGWIALVFTQVMLIRGRSYRLHRILGWSSLALFVALVTTSLMVMALMFSGKSGLPFFAAKFFGYSDVVDLPLLLFAFGAAIYWRKDRHMHSRLMAVTVLTSIVPALARMFNILFWRSFDPGLFLSMHPTYLLILGTLGVAILVDRKNGKLGWPLPFAFGWFTILYATQWPMMQAQWYDSLSRWIGTWA
jgi:uncharacterized membrane protein